ncbi:MAG: HAD-IB family hydrolase [Actinomycetota bacterium]|nr:HAD-IB family hydrolase [Actinomycetota bacterium]
MGATEIVKHGIEGENPQAAAFLDLDRTVLDGASGPALTEALRAEGILSDRGSGKLVESLEGVAYRLYDDFGESIASMALARAGAWAARGWPVDAVRRAGERAVGALDHRVAGYVRALLAEHRRDGRVVVLATTTPADLVTPFARQLGFDDVIATRYAEHDGHYTGAIEGPFVWSFGKLAAVRGWAKARGVDLTRSYAYSDSVFDVPLLRAVGHPYAVNADARLAIVAAVQRWPSIRLDAPPGVPKVLGREAYNFLRPFVRPSLVPYARFDIAGVERVPPAGPAILVANHRSYFDPVPLAIVAARCGRPVRFLAKKELFDIPGLGLVGHVLGGIPVDRSGHGSRSLDAAQRVLEAGELLVVLPQGTIPRGHAFFSPVLEGKTGAARLAAKTGAPVIPVGLWGTEAVWPRSARLPRLTNVASPPLVQVRVGEPVALSRKDAAEDTRVVMDAIAALLPALASRPKPPSAEELAATYPPGHGPCGKDDR